MCVVDRVDEPVRDVWSSLCRPAERLSALSRVLDLVILIVYQSIVCRSRVSQTEARYA